MNDISCEYCGTVFQATNKRGPKPRYCKDACKLAAHRARKAAGTADAPTVVTATTKPATPPTAPGPQAPVLTLRDVIRVAELDLSVKQCDAVINAFTKARLRAAKRERDQR